MKQLCIRCRKVAGFWVYKKGDQTARRPWCLTCICKKGHDLNPAIVTEKFE